MKSCHLERALVAPAGLCMHFYMMEPSQNLLLQPAQSCCHHSGLLWVVSPLAACCLPPAHLHTLPFARPWAPVPQAQPFPHQASCSACTQRLFPVLTSFSLGSSCISLLSCCCLAFLGASSLCPSVRNSLSSFLCPWPLFQPESILCPPVWHLSCLLTLASHISHRL